MIKKLILGLAVAAMLSPACASASLVMLMFSGADSVVVIDDMLSGSSSSTGVWNSTHDDTDLSDGTVTFNGMIGDFTVNATVGNSQPAIGANTLSLTSVNISGGSAGTMELYLLDTDFADNGFTFNSQVGGTTGGTVSFITAYNGLNDESSFTPLFNWVTAGVDESFEYSTDSPNMVAGNLAYSMLVGVQITHDSAGDFTGFHARLSQVPEPTSLLAWSALLIAACPLRRRRK